MFVVCAEQVARNDIAAQDRGSQQQDIRFVAHKCGHYGQHPAKDSTPNQRSEAKETPRQIAAYGISQDEDRITMFPVVPAEKNKDDQPLRDPYGAPDIPEAFVHIGPYGLTPSLSAIDRRHDDPDEQDQPYQRVAVGANKHFERILADGTDKHKPSP